MLMNFVNNFYTILLVQAVSDDVNVCLLNLASFLFSDDSSDIYPGRYD